MSALNWAVVENALQAWIVNGSGLATDHVIWSQQTAPRPTGEFISMRLTVLGLTGRDWLDRYDNIVAVGSLPVSAVSTVASTLTVTAHGLATGTGALQAASTLTLPGGLVAATNYWPIVLDANTLQLASSFQNAVAATPVPIALTSVGSGTITVSGTPTTTAAGREIVQRARGPRQAQLQLQCFAGAPSGGAATGTTSPEAVLHDAISSYVLESQSYALSAAGIGVGTIEPIRSIDGIVNTVRFEPRAIAVVHLHLASEIIETSTYVQIVNATDQIPTTPTTVTVKLS